MDGEGGSQPDRRRAARVLCDVTGVRKPFDYLVPPALADDVGVGTSVRVELHGRRVSGWVVDDDASPPAGVELRPLLAVRGVGPPPAVVEVSLWAAWRWAGHPAHLLRTASSPTLVRALASPAARLPGDAAGDSVCADALAGGTTVLRTPPAYDRLPLVRAAASRLSDAASPPQAGVLVLAPSHDLAGRLARRLESEGWPVALLPDQWARARAGNCVVVGSRAGALAPLPALAAAVVLDAHDEVYHEERAPTWCAWEVVAERARRDGAPCVLASPCPTLDVLQSGRLVTVGRADERKGWAAVDVADRRGDDPRAGLYGDKVVAALRATAAIPGQRMLCVLNRTGRARLLACTACHELARCERCGGAAESALDPGGQRHLHCRRCGTDRPVVCARCGATRLKTLRVGVSRAREELEALARAPVAEVWGPDAVVADDAALVVGTEAVLHRAGRADVVAFLDFDAELLAPRLRAAEESLALLARAARLVGGRGAGRVIVQTRQPDHPAIVSAATADPAVLAGAELVVRRELGLPPVRAMAVVRGDGADEFGRQLAATASTSGAVEVSGPVDGAWWLRADSHRALCDLLDRVTRPPGRLRVEVDPVRA